ncbi:MAG: hypothetical protein MMC23_003979 [Stictis urceolatum]|nr:hypothetical protein [Stictis urceolata]
MAGSWQTAGLSMADGGQNLTYLVNVNLDNKLELWYRNLNVSSQWNRGDVSSVAASPNSSIASVLAGNEKNRFFFLNDSGEIMSIPLVGGNGAEATFGQEVDSGVKAVLGSQLFAEASPDRSTETLRPVNLFVQLQGNDIMLYEGQGGQLNPFKPAPVV